MKNALFGLYAQPGRNTKIALAVLPTVIIVLVYLFFSEQRLAENPNDKLLPSFATMADSFLALATEPNKRTGELVLWSDTFASLFRLFTGVVLASITGLLMGINTALFPGMKALVRPTLTFLSIIPPLTILPILFIIFGVGETSKIILIFIGTVFLITRDIDLSVSQLPKEQITKALSLGASQLQVVYKIVLPQTMPRLINTTRLSLGAAWLFLIAAEMISATDGLGYRIGLVRRYLSMDIIIPYVLWITLIGFLIDWSMRMWVKNGYKWYGGNLDK